MAKSLVSCRFYTIAACDIRTDGQTDGRTCDDSIYRTSIAWAVKTITDERNFITRLQYQRALLGL